MSDGLSGYSYGMDGSEESGMTPQEACDKVVSGDVRTIKVQCRDAIMDAEIRRTGASAIVWWVANDDRWNAIFRWEDVAVALDTNTPLKVTVYDDEEDPCPQR
jgi:hypothetical protein